MSGPSGAALGPVGVVVGNPKAGSRTLRVAEAVARAAAEAVGSPTAPLEVVDLALLGTRLFDWSDPVVRAEVDRVAACRLVVVASPVYKAAYTGLLKSFLDWYPTTGLAGVTAVPVMVGAGAHHALAVEVHLRPVLIEIGATLPTRGLFVLEGELDRLAGTVGAWLETAASQLRASLARPAGPVTEPR